MICLLRGRKKGGGFRERRRMRGKEREGAVLWWPIMETLTCFMVLGRLQSSMLISQTVAYERCREIREEGIWT